MLLSLILGTILTFVELNCENLFDCRHDSLKQDYEYLPESTRRWTSGKYWRKIDHIAKEIISCGRDTSGYHLPDFVALCEIENDSVMRDLTKRSPLRTLQYEYIMTNSPDTRGIDVALMYHSFSFRPINHASLRITPLKGMRPTRDILYVSGQVVSGDTLHIFVVHAPSRFGGERKTRPYRMAVAQRIQASVDSILNIQKDAKIIIAGDFNDNSDSPAIEYLKRGGLKEISDGVRGDYGAKGSYCYKGKWETIDHILVCHNLLPHWLYTRIHDLPFLLEEDNVYGGFKPCRTYNGYRYQPQGYSDHLPIVAKFAF